MGSGVNIHLSAVPPIARGSSLSRRRYFGATALGACLCFFALCSVAVLAQDAPNDETQEKGNQRCFKCHGDPKTAGLTPETLAGMVRIPPGQQPVFRTVDTIGGLYISPEIFAASAHGKMECTACHVNVTSLPHEQRTVSLACRDCHAKAYEDLTRGAHRAVAAENGKVRPTCSRCHGATHEMVALKQPRAYETSIALVAICVECHNEAKNQKFNPAEGYRDSMHGRSLYEKGLAVAPTCAECHGNHAILPAADPASSMNRKRAPETCGRCHKGVVDVYMTSIHGQHLLEDKEKAASCTSCHSSHGVEEVNTPFLLGVVKECSTCHIEKAHKYLMSYHGKATSLGFGSAAVCSSCHGSHDIRPNSDPKSRVAAANLKTTCAKCHENVTDNFVKYIAHADYRNPSENPWVFYTWVFMMALIVGTLGAFIPHSLLWLQRSALQRLINPLGHHLGDRRHAQRMVQRFRPIHRFTHLLVVVSFMGLVATGFPLKYSDSEWAQSFANAFGGVRAMGLLHRGFGLLTFAYAAVHVAFLIRFFAKECPRPIWRFLIGPDSLIFSWRDVSDAFAMLRWFFWLGPRPKLDRWAYFEKFDYFGEIWGIFVIGTTGIILWMPHLFTRWLPGWILNCATVVHSFEALLAASVIFLVHFFNTHLRPEKFPIDMTIITGQMSEAEMEEERGAEYERLVREGRLEQRIEEPVAVGWRILGGFVGIGLFLFGIMLIVLAIGGEVHQIRGSAVLQLIVEKAREFLG